jgi:hypothetical protein
LKKIVLAVLAGCAVAFSTTAEGPPPAARVASIFNGVRTATSGHRIDAHSGTILRAQDGLFYWYGEAYACGFRWTDPASPYCGAQVYRSSDLVRWQGPWPLFDAAQPTWQELCMHQPGAPGNGCFRPKVAFNPRTHLYVLWLNVPGFAGDGFRVLTSPNPAGPFALIGKPALRDAAIPDWRGNRHTQDGDESLFVNKNGDAWLVWSRGGRLLEERLDASFTTGAGAPTEIRGFPQLEPWQGAESPSMFEHDGRYFVAMSLPRCPYCTATGTAIERATSPGGPWTYDGVVTWDSCGGQPNEVDHIGGGTWLWSSDQWTREPSAGKFPRLNETLATQAWEPLSFVDGHVKPIDCGLRYSLRLS